jgi:hypothetical protein
VLPTQRTTRAGCKQTLTYTIYLPAYPQTQFQKDEQILAQGVKNYNLFRIKNGSVRIEINGNYIAQLPANEIFGYVSMHCAISFAAISF